MAYYQIREVDWERSRTEIVLDAPYLKYEFTSGVVEGLPEVVGHKRLRASEGGPSSDLSSTFRAFKMYTLPTITSTTTLEFCCQDHADYCRHRDGVQHSTPPPPEDDVSDDGALDDDWTLQDL